MRTFLALVLALGLSACAEVDQLTDTARTATRSAPSGSGVPTGTWDTTYGDMTLTPLADGRARATYKGEDGELDGRMSGLTYTGYWTEPSSARACSSSRNGTVYWGRFSYTFDPALTTFDGGWSYCDNAPSTEGDWTGVKG